MKQNRVERIICFLGEYSQTVCTAETGRAIAEHTYHHLGAHASCARTTTLCIVYYKFRGSLVTQTIRPSEYSWEYRFRKRCKTFTTNPYGAFVVGIPESRIN